MTEEELNKMIGEFLPYPSKGQHHALKRFANLVAAAEREECAKVCEDWTRTPETTGMELSLCARAIRARGQE